MKFGVKTPLYDPRRCSPVLGILDGAALGREGERRAVRDLQVRVGVIELERMARVDVAGQFALEPGFRAWGGDRLVGDGQRGARRLFGVAAGGEEPQPVLDDLPAERRRVDLGQDRRNGGFVLGLNGRVGRPVRVGEVHARGSGVDVSAAPRDRVDDAAREAAVLGGDVRRHDLRFLNRLFDHEPGCAQYRTGCR